MNKRITYKPLSCFLTEYTEKNVNNVFRPVAVGKYGIRTRESIYTKELASDYSKNKLIFQNTLTVGMGSNQIDIGILMDDETYSVSPAYHTYRIQGINPKYLEYCLKCKNAEMFAKYSKRGARQGKSIELKKWLTYEIPVYSEEEQDEIVGKLDLISAAIECEDDRIQLYDELVKSKFVEMFGDVVKNSYQWETYRLDSITQSRLGKMLDSKKQTGLYPFPYLANFNVQWFKFNLSSLNTMDFNEADQIEFELKDGDLLVCEGGEVGRCAIWRNELQPCYFQKALHRVRCNQEVIIPEYLAWWFKYNCENHGLDSAVGTNATIAHLTGVKLKALQIAVPPIELQKSFQSFFMDLQELLSTANQKVEYYNELLSVEMHKYFD